MNTLKLRANDSQRILNTTLSWKVNNCGDARLTMKITEEMPGSVKTGVCSNTARSMPVPVRALVISIISRPSRMMLNRQQAFPETVLERIDRERGEIKRVHMS